MEDKTKIEFEHISEILQRALKEFRAEKIDTFIAICSIWDDIVEDSISKNVRPSAYKKPILILSANSSAWIHHLQFRKKEIMDQINTTLKKKAVSEIKLRIGFV